MARKRENTDEEPKGSRSVGNLKLVLRAAARYPGRIAAALFFLALSSAATLAIPYGFKQVIDRGFGSGGEISSAAVTSAFQYLLMIVVVLAVATGFRFYFVSWLGERTVAVIRRQVQRNLLTLP